jgi:anti-sigma regulatory factor (Ser/Thr protein kinase)
VHSFQSAIDIQEETEAGSKSIPRLRDEMSPKEQGVASMSSPSRVTIARVEPRFRSRTFPSRLDQLALIRQFVEEVAAAIPLGNSATFDLKTAVSEASANAIEHGLGEGDLEVSAKRGHGRLTITVSHPGGFRPRVDGDPTRAHRGMGLPLMVALTNELTVTRPRRGGTSVSLSVFLD